MIMDDSKFYTTVIVHPAAPYIMIHGKHIGGTATHKVQVKNKQKNPKKTKTPLSAKSCSAQPLCKPAWLSHTISLTTNSVPSHKASLHFIRTLQAIILYFKVHCIAKAVKTQYSNINKRKNCFKSAVIDISKEKMVTLKGGFTWLKYLK